MSWPRRRRRGIFDLFDIEGLFREIEESFRQFEEEIEKMIQQVSEEGRVEKFGPYFYGVRITIGPDGVPRIEEFGNIRRVEGGRRVLSEEIEPLVDVIDAGDEIWVVAELPGVNKDKIDVKVTERKVTIRASNGKKYYKEVELPAEVDPKTARAKYNNGVLDVKIKKKGSKKEEEGVSVKVE
ncbi:MAG: Hsp20/alpha crystallin family protein [Desulfurococcales archaeon]|nr:Hsp20/alpha crystallin family protein [Desulfurococcales archaeon]